MEPGLFSPTHASTRVSQLRERHGHLPACSYQDPGVILSSPPQLPHPRKSPNTFPSIPLFCPLPQHLGFLDPPEASSCFLPVHSGSPLDQKQSLQADLTLLKHLLLSEDSRNSQHILQDPSLPVLPDSPALSVATLQRHQFGLERTTPGSSLRLPPLPGLLPTPLLLPTPIILHIFSKKIN